MKPLKFPALLAGLALLLGALFALQSPLALLPLLFLLRKKTVFLMTLLFLFPIIYLYHTYTFPSSGTVVSGRFNIHSLSEANGFSPGWNYRGILKTKEGRICCQVYSKKRYLADCAYTVTGTVSTQNKRFYFLRPFVWQPLERSFSLAEIRYHAKKWVKNYIHRHNKHERVAHFLTGMATGELEDQVMMEDFKNLGLSHIMAISGFHFALLTFAFHIFFRLFLPPKPEALFLMILLTLYLLFIGNSPSIQRAWVVAMVFLFGQLLERPPVALNSLGIAILIAILLNPLSVTTLSFQLSFLATAGILLLYEPTNRLLQLWLPKRSLKEVLDRHYLWQHGYVLISLLREALTLTLAVHLALFPLLLYFFHTFSLNSLIYNLFFPFCASIALFLFLLGILTGGLLHPLNDWYCNHLLLLTESPPLLLKSLYLDNVSSTIIVVYITTLFISAIYYNHTHARTQNEGNIYL